LAGDARTVRASASAAALAALSPRSRLRVLLRPAKRLASIRDRMLSISMRLGTLPSEPSSSTATDSFRSSALTMLFRQRVSNCSSSSGFRFHKSLERIVMRFSKSASNTGIRRSRHMNLAISSTSSHCNAPLGSKSAKSASRKASKSSGFSAPTTSCLAVSPWVTAFSRERAFPEVLFGPVLRLAFARFASSCLCETMVYRPRATLQRAR
jgi:hypothetical protein